MSRRICVILSSMVLGAILVIMAPITHAEGPIERSLKKFDGWLAKKSVKQNSMEAAVLRLEQEPKKYQIRVHELLKGDVYCNIQSVVVDRATGWIVIVFDYRGGTRVSLTPVAEDSFIVTGSYIINLPLLGNSDVKVNLTFHDDGSARGEWSNMGSRGAFDIVGGV